MHQRGTKQVEAQVANLTRGSNVLQYVRKNLESLTIGGIGGNILHEFEGNLLLKSDRPSILIVQEDVGQAILDLHGSGVWFNNSSQKVT